MWLGTPADGASADGPVRHAGPRPLLSMVLVGSLFAAVGVARLLGIVGGGGEAAAIASPVERGVAWMDTHDYSVLVQVDGNGARVLNAEATRRDDVVEAAIQTVRQTQGRSARYLRIRLAAGQDLAHIGSSLPSGHLDLVADLATPAAVLTRLTATGSLTYAGTSGDAVLYRHRDGSTLYMVGDRPARVVIKGSGGTTQTWQFDPLSPA